MTKHADEITLTITPEVQSIGDKTEVGTIAFMAAVKQLAMRWGQAKEGDQLEWEATLKGRITVTQRMLEAARDEFVR